MLIGSKDSHTPLKTTDFFFGGFQGGFIPFLYSTLQQL